MRALRILVVALSIFATYVIADDEVKLDEGVIILTNGNYEKVVSTNQFVLVEFYAPWCGHCKALAPEYAKAAQTLAESDSPIKLAKVDATEEAELATKFEVKGYPTLKFFRDGKPSEYGGGRTADEIISWLNKKTGPSAKTLDSAEEIKAFVDEVDVAVVGFFTDVESTAAKEFLSVAGAIDDYPFAIVSNEAAATEFKITGDAVVVFKKYDEGRHDLTTDFTVDAISRFIKGNALPLIVDFNHETAQKVFGGEIKSHVLMFLSKEAGHYEKFLEEQKKIATDFKEKVLFVSINTDDEDHGRILEFFGMKKDEVPAARVIRLTDEMAKYKPTKDVLGDGSEMRAFVNDFLDGKLKQHLLSQDLPEDWDKEAVKVLVASNFDEVVFNAETSVLVEFYAPWCGHCKQLAPIYDKLGEKFAEDKTVVIAKIDATVNELEHTKINSFPTIKLYKKGDNKVVEYSGERTLEGLARFLETDGEYGQSAPNEEGVVFTGARTLEGLEDFILGKEAKVEVAEEAEEAKEEVKEAEEEVKEAAEEVEEAADEAEEEDEDDDTPKRVEL